MSVNVTSATRDIKELNPLVQTMLNIALEKIKMENITPLVVETFRPVERQYYLYGQGRTKSTCIIAGVPKKYAQKYARGGDKVTWTLNSIHCKRCAVDLIPKRNGKAIWDSKDSETKQIVNIMESVGFEAGANWAFSPDSPHFQVKGIVGKKLSRKNNNKFVTKVIQKRLKKLGFYTDFIVDGIWGNGTDNAIILWKKSIKLKQTKDIDCNTLKKLLTC
jgi:peptidoglycan L-alanyl-D-glutamate endopeptidase CwlK